MDSAKYKYTDENIETEAGQIGQTDLGYLWIILEAMARHCYRVRWLMNSAIFLDTWGSLWNKWFSALCATNDITINDPLVLRGDGVDRYKLRLGIRS